MTPYTLKRDLKKTWILVKIEYQMYSFFWQFNLPTPNKQKIGFDRFNIFFSQISYCVCIMIYQIQLLFNLLGNQLGYKYPQIIHNLYSVTKKTKVIARKRLCLQTDNDRQTHKTIRDTVPQLVLPYTFCTCIHIKIRAF